jgi:hypothetical protein
MGASADVDASVDMGASADMGPSVDIGASVDMGASADVDASADVGASVGCSAGIWRVTASGCSAGIWRVTVCSVRDWRLRREERLSTLKISKGRRSSEMLRKMVPEGSFITLVEAVLMQLSNCPKKDVSA